MAYAIAAFFCAQSARTWLGYLHAAGNQNLLQWRPIVVVVVVVIVCRGALDDDHDYDNDNDNDNDNEHNLARDFRSQALEPGSMGHV
jgi:hypothetical protein